MSFASRFVLGVFVVLVLSRAASSTTFVWNNPSGGSWYNSTNWTPSGTPTLADDVDITLAGTYTVFIDSSAECSDLNLGAASGIQTLEVSLNTVFVIYDGGSIGANGYLHVVDPGTQIEWRGSSAFSNHGDVVFETNTELDLGTLQGDFTNEEDGNMTFNGNVTVSGSGTVLRSLNTMAQLGGGFLTVDVPWHHGGNASFTLDEGDLYIQELVSDGVMNFNNSTTTTVFGGNDNITVGPNGVMNIDGAVWFFGTDPTANLGNEGEIHKTGPGDATVELVYENNGDGATGALFVEEGRLLLVRDDGGHRFNGPVTISDGGELAVGGGLFDTLSSIHSETENTGTLTITTGGTVDINCSAFTFTGTLNLNGGTTNFEPSVAQLDTFESIHMLNGTVLNSSHTIYTREFIDEGGTVNATLVLIGDDHFWNNDAGGDWFTASNWTPNSVPTGIDNVDITLDGTYAVQISSDAQCLAFVLGGTSGLQTLEVFNNIDLTIYNGGTNGVSGFIRVYVPGTDVIIRGPVGFSNFGEMAFETNTALDLGTLQGDFTNEVGGVITCTGNVTFSGSGTVFRNYGAMTTTEPGILSVSVPWYHSNTATFDLTNGGWMEVPELVSDGIMTFHDSTTTILFGGTELLHVGSNGVMNIYGYEVWFFGGPAGNLGNEGEIHKINAGDATSPDLAYELNGNGATGALFVEEGRLRLLRDDDSHRFNGPVTISDGGELEVGGGYFESPSSIHSETENTGVLTVTTGATMYINSSAFTFTGTLNINGGETFLEPSVAELDTFEVIHMLNGTVLTSSHTIYTRNFENEGGTLNANFVVQDFVWEGGAIGGDETDSLVIPPGGTLTLSGSDSSSLTGQDLLIGGDADLSGSGVLTLDSGSTIVVKDVGSLTVGDSITIESAAGGDTLINNGEMFVSSPNDTSVLNIYIANIPGVFRAPGTIDILSGRTIFGGGGNNSGDINIGEGGELILDGRLENNGAISMADGSLTTVNDTLRNNQSGIIGLNGDTQIGGNGVVDNNGQINSGGGFALSLTNRVISPTLINHATNGFVDVVTDTLTLAGGGVNYGDFEIHPGTVLKVFGNFENAAGGFIHGGGILDVSEAVFVNNGTISPGASPGILTILGDVTLGASSHLQIELNGRTAGQQYDRLVAEGMVHFGGTLDIVRDTSFVPSPSDTFQLLTYFGMTGDFAEITGTALGNGQFLDISFGPNGLKNFVCNSGAAVLDAGAVSLMQALYVGETAQDSFTVCNGGVCPLGYNAVFTVTTPAVAPWLTIDAGGFGIIRGGRCGSSLVVSYNTNGLLAGVYHGVITVNSNSGINPVHLIPVQLDVIATGETIETAFQIVSLPASFSGNNCGFEDNYHEVCPFDDPGSPDAVFYYTALVDTVVNVSLCYSGFDTHLYIYRDAVTPGLPYACNDDADPCPGSSGLYRSYLSNVSLPDGHTYYFVVDGWAGDCGDYVLDIQPTICPPLSRQVIRHLDNAFGTPRVRVTFQSDASGLVRMWYTTSPNAVFPTGFTVFASGVVTPGEWNGIFDTVLGLRATFVTTIDCTPPGSLTDANNNLHAAENLSPRQQSVEAASARKVPLRRD